MLNEKLNFRGSVYSRVWHLIEGGCLIEEI